MKLLRYKLTTENNQLEIPIDPENPAFSIVEVVENIPNPNGNMGQAADLALNYIRINDKKESDKLTFGYGLYIGKDKDILDRYSRNDSSIQKVSLELTVDENWEDVSIELEIQLGRSLIDIKKPWQEFNNHISNPVNTKIFFSAPFGQGKTTFLNEFFRQEQETYEVFRIFPVNYSVANNQDIFRYIKADLLYQLVVEKESPFEKLEASYLKTIPAFVKKNPEKILAPFLMLIPEVGKNLFAFYEKMKTVTDSFIDEHEKQSKDDEKAVDSFLSTLIEQEGSIYEDNLLTQIIRQQITCIRENKKKKSVLVIDDLDRLDPEHTFRILNIISAHYDIHASSDRSNGDHNKFGFDKIIVVCDIENVKNIFEHRYGSRTNFSGYINKFFSTSYFGYDNKKTMFSLIDQLVDYQARDGGPRLFTWPMRAILQNLIKADQLSLRDLLKLQNFSLRESIKDLDPVYADGRSNYLRGLFTPIIAFLSKVYSQETLIAKIEVCKNAGMWATRTNCNDLCWDLMGALAVKFEDDDEPNYYYKYNGIDYKLRLERDHYSGRMKVNHGNAESEKLDFNEIYFRPTDFYILLIENIKLFHAVILEWETKKDH